MLAWQDLIGDDRLMAYFDMMVEAAGFGQPMVFQDDQPAYSDKDDLLIKTPDDYLKLERYDVEKAERIRMTLDVAEILSRQARRHRAGGGHRRRTVGGARPAARHGGRC